MLQLLSDARHLAWCFALVATLSLLGCDGAPVPEDAGAWPTEVDPQIFAEPGEPIQGISEEQRAAFQRGRALAERTWETGDGLGPRFNTTTCVTCHEHPVVGARSARQRDSYLVYRSFMDGSQDPLGIHGVLGHFHIEDARAETPSQTNLLARRHAPAILGLGALTRVPGSVVADLADPNDADGDGVSGRVNFEFGLISFIGFKGQTASLERMIRGQLLEHIGITTDPLTAEQRALLPRSEEPSERSFEGDVGRISAPQVTDPDVPTRDVDDQPDPELSPEGLFDLVSWTMLLGVPEPDPHTTQTEQGEDLFAAVGCASCHVPGLATPTGIVPAYSDLLMHDMGPGLGDGIEGATTSGNETRTLPLWFVGAGGPYLHDGRAADLDQAIRFHGGEAGSSRDNYLAITQEERAALLAFLNRFGGRYAVGQPVPEAGEPFGPAEGVDAAEFGLGYAGFIALSNVSDGLGPTFDADSCVSCHSLGSGGAGPRDVNVVWQGVPSGESIVEPSTGRVLARQSVILERPEPAASISFLMSVQPLPLLVSRWVAEADEAAIRALADPDDMNSDGISGRAGDVAGALGRFGWKAEFPTLESASSACAERYLGLTVTRTDTDGVPDPELDVSPMVGFLSGVSGPGERAPIDVFVNAGCADCHAPSLATSAGGTVDLYSDLLLHDLGGAGIGVGAATASEYRTPSLRGFASTAPYFHDGAAYTLAAVMERHRGEAASSRSLWEALPADEQAELEVFLRSL